MSKNVAIIPARGGSKRIPRKNIRDFCGKPMIAWSIEIAIKSDLFERVIVSTDDPEIREISLAAGAEVPFERPQELANDQAATLPVIRHAIQFLSLQDSSVTNFCCIYATAPFLDPLYLKEGVAILQMNPQIDFVFSATSFDFSIFRAIKVDEENKVTMFWPEHEITRSQDLPTAYHDAGQFYWGNAKAWLTKNRIFNSDSRVVILPRNLVQDIDTPEDWIQAELKFKALLRSTHV